MTLASLLSINLFTKNPYNGILKTIYKRVKNKEVKRINSCNSNYRIGKQNISDSCNALINSNLSHQACFENKTHVNKIILVLIFLMLRWYNVLSDYIFSHQLKNNSINLKPNYPFKRKRWIISSPTMNANNNEATALGGESRLVGRSSEEEPGAKTMIFSQKEIPNQLVSNRSTDFRTRFFPLTTSESWNDWKWQLRNSITSID